MKSYFIRNTNLTTLIIFIRFILWIQVELKLRMIDENIKIKMIGEKG